MWTVCSLTVSYSVDVSANEWVNGRASDRLSEWMNAQISALTCNLHSKSFKSSHYYILFVVSYLVFAAKCVIFPHSLPSIRTTLAFAITINTEKRPFWWQPARNWKLQMNAQNWMREKQRTTYSKECNSNNKINGAKWRWNKKKKQKWKESDEPKESRGNEKTKKPNLWKPNFGVVYTNISYVDLSMLHSKCGICCKFRFSIGFCLKSAWNSLIFFLKFTQL